MLSPSDQLQGGQTTLPDAPEDTVPLTVPASAAQYLREYQKDGIRWLYQQYIRNLGGVLGDDMGASVVRLGRGAELHSYPISLPRRAGLNLCWLCRSRKDVHVRELSRCCAEKNVHAQ
eukprot:COSAG02_NODE_2760_length_8077_cov_2.993106_7_plen_118_part_00